MYLKELEIIGFKSFAEKTLLEFYPGITIIVGPNGCGKSNILDALRWGLGEQNCRVLRATRMEEIIFNGTDRHLPLNFAEVSVVFSNEDRRLNYDADEVRITRRLFRSGESQYLINRKQVRLKDILELFMGTGIGAEAYSIVEQGKIDLILSVKPEERRVVFDEAAGITKYKVKKRETLRKLKETEQNLLRIVDIIREVKRQLNSLERQAKKAKRYQELYNRLKDKEILLAVIKWVSLEKDKTAYEKELNEYREMLESKQHERQNVLDSLERLRNTAFSLEEQISSIQEEISNLVGEFEQDAAKIEMNRERVLQFKEQVKIFAEERESLLSRIEEKRKILAELENKIGILKEDIKKIEAKIEDEKTGLDQTVSETLKLEKLLEEQRNVLFTYKYELSKLTNEKSVIESELKGLSSYMMKLSNEKAKIQNDILLSRQKRDEYDSSLKSLENQILDISTKGVPNLVLKIKQLDQECVMLESEAEELKLGITTMEAQKDMLSHLEAKYLALPENRTFDLWVEKAKFEIGHIIARVEALLEENGDWIHLKCNGNVLPSQLSFLEDEINKLKLLLKNKEEFLNSKRREKISLNDEKQNLELKLSSLKAEVSRVNLLIEQEKNLISRYEEQLYSIETEIQQKNKLISEKKALLEEVNGKSKALQEQVEQISNELRHLEEELIQKKEGSHVVESMVNEMASKKVNLELELQRILVRISSLRESINQDTITVRQKEDLKSTVEKKISQVEEVIDSLIEKKKDWSDKILKLKSKKESKREEYARVRSNIEAIEERRKRLDLEVNDLQRNIYNIELKLQKLNFDAKNLVDRLKELYGLDISDALETTVVPVGVDLERLELEIEQMKDNLKKLGAVNTVAIEEYEELKERYEFLNSQKDDLVKSKDLLKQTIKELNSTSEKLFVEVFMQIREEFQRFFRMLFGGGQADIFILDETDVLSSGIEIKARPPGKQLRSISLLSGGEKALTAVALIFAIFKVKPSPFCILDEVEAALDELNVDRFVRLLREFAKDTQFLVITHNKKTIASGGVIYGVTMPTTGISKIISVKLENKSALSNEVDEVMER